MLHEFALEPGLLNTWDRFRLYTAEFGFDKGRLISRYPKTWKKMVYDALGNCSEMQRKRIEERLTNIDEKMVASGRDWRAEVDWLQNAEHVHLTKPFHAIIAAANPRNNRDVIPGDDLHGSLKWNIPAEIRVRRDADAMAAALAPILKGTRKVIFADPHFSPGKPKAVRALIAYLRQIESGLTEAGCEIEFHTLFEAENKIFENECQRLLPRQIATGLKLKLVRWNLRDGGDGFHNRYIFTDRGGVRLAWGLDEGQVSETDDLTLLDHRLFIERRAQFVGDATAYDLAHEFVVLGKA